MKYAFMIMAVFFWIMSCLTIFSLTIFSLTSPILINRGLLYLILGWQFYSLGEKEKSDEKET